MAETKFAEHEREPEMKIGMPTDVKHVAHIGWDGPSVNTAPSWMNEFQTQAGSQSAPSVHGEVREENPVKKSSKGGTSSARDKPELPKSSKSTSVNGLGGPSTKEKTDKAKQSKKTKKSKDPNQATESTSKDTKKNSKRKKLKDLNGEGSSRRYRTVQDLDTVSETESQYSCASDFIDREGT